MTGREWNEEERRRRQKDPREGEVLDGTARGEPDREEAAQRSPGGEEVVQWLTSSARMVQEVVARRRLLPADVQAEMDQFLKTSPQYGEAFLTSMDALTLRDRNPASRVRADSMERRGEAAQAFQPILKSVSSLKGAGRNVMALTPELFPDALMRVWPPRRPLPEMILINFDLQVPRVAVVQRMRGGPEAVDRSTLATMTATIRQVMGQPNILREVASRQGIKIEGVMDKIHVEAAPVMWSPTLELGDILYDRSFVQLDREEESTSRKQTRKLEGIRRRQDQQGPALDDLQERLAELNESWAEAEGKEAQEVREKVEGLQGRADHHQKGLDNLKERSRFVEGQVVRASPEVDNLFVQLEKDTSTFEADVTRLAEEVATQEKQLAEFQRETDRRKKLEEAESRAEEVKAAETNEGRRKDRMKAEGEEFVPEKDEQNQREEVSRPRRRS